MKIFCALPVYKAIHPACKHSINRLEKESGHQFVLRFCFGHPIINNARTYLFGRYLQLHKIHNFDYYWQLDSDIWFQPESIDKIIDRGFDCATGLYSYKDFDHAGKAVFTRMPGAIETEDGWLRGLFAPGGFLFLKSSAIDKLVKKYKDLKVYIPDNFDSFDKTECWSYALWSGLIRKVPSFYPGKPMYFEEDYAFTTRIREAGFDIYASLKVHLRHCAGEKFYELPFRKDKA